MPYKLSVDWAFLMVLRLQRKKRKHERATSQTMRERRGEPPVVLVEIFDGLGHQGGDETSLGRD